jgi:hypothetical protein
MKKVFALTMIVLIGLSLTDCTDRDEPVFNEPDSYAEFENVSYTGQTQRLGQLVELATYAKSANTSGIRLDENRLLAMYQNRPSEAGWVNSYDSTKQIKNKTFSLERENFEQLIQDIALASKSDQSGKPGTAGVRLSNDGSKSYLLNAKGAEIAQLLEKGLMGAFIYYQICNVYTGNEKMNVDNEEVVDGQGTKMQHHWDEAFGYYGVPEDFPSNKDGIVFWGKYSNSRDPLFNTNQMMMDAYISGRHAIDFNRYTERDEARNAVREGLELITATTAIHYINSALNNPTDTAIRCHALSEAYAFIYSIKFSPDRKFELDEIDELLVSVGGDARITQPNFYEIKDADLELVRQAIVDRYAITVDPTTI